MALYSDLILLEAPPGSVAAEPLTEVQKASWRQGIPTMVLALPKLKGEAVLKMAETVKDILKKHRPEQAEEIDEVWKTLSTDPEERAAFIKEFTDRPAGAVKVLPRGEDGIGDVRTFVADQTAKPFVMAYAEKIVKEINLKEWDKEYCPVCGSQPGFARLSKAVGRRSLYCSLCETEWAYKRIGCPYCRTVDQKKLQYFTVQDVDGGERHRVYVCDNCKGYIKTLDESRVPENEKVYLFLEDVKTLHLDALAVREGYSPRPTVPGEM